jgi:imidazolonepropionase-like amidohydrolase
LTGARLGLIAKSPFQRKVEGARARVLPVADIIRSATLIGAKLFGLEGEVGALVPGAYADLLVVDGDPYRDLSVLQHDGAHMPGIMKGGTFFKTLL